ncbi:MAG: D-alanyl-D-alanine carboxypeptidase [Flavobacteriales bacterium]|jgi:LAS superfamily LD-carboxypeptidase LdcB|nr:MAG: D-alanyl-D-alanine carboxypeptidase family protein [Flavobacteriales bacterium]CAI8275255.1 MAG: D-alanyl-D-alanine carboxypeptidase [Flavobacteriales bacterium]|tara:strand:- start:393 stop:1100 length:708 start_codon:yes stop_codon:yes gene_type:complete
MRLVLFFVLLFQMAVAQPTLVQTLGLDDSHLVELEGNLLTAKTATAFCAMQVAALRDGIDLQLVSAYRSFDRQKYIWEDKYKRYTAEGLSPKDAIDRILQYSTIPGTSRHHWGTDIDITDSNAPKQKRILVPEKFHNNGPFAPLRKWMEENANRFGFYLVYTNDASRTGFSYEPWHYSYLPEAKHYQKQYDSRTAFAYFKSVGIYGSAYINVDFWEEYYTLFFKGINAKLTLPSL